jgi:nucleotide-binding universal stress UspA family protein
MFDRILLALDEPGDREAVLPHLRMLVRAGESRVVVMKTVSFLETIVEMPHELSPEIDSDDEAGEVYVSAVVEALKSEGIDADGFTNIGRSGLSIAAAAERVEASLIVVASQAHSRLAELLVGGRVETLLHATSIPVYVVPPSAPALTGTILVPVDQTEFSLEAIPTAAALARAARSGLLFLHVLDSETQTALFKARDLALREGVPADLMTRQGDPATKILEVCREIRPRMIVIRSGGSPGGLTHRLLHLSPLPLLVVRRRVSAEGERRDLFGGVPFPAHRTIPIPAALWIHRIPENPLLGIGQIGN